MVLQLVTYSMDYPALHHLKLVAQGSQLGLRPPRSGLNNSYRSLSWEWPSRLSAGTHPLHNQQKFYRPYLSSITLFHGVTYRIIYTRLVTNLTTYSFFLNCREGTLGVQPP